MRTLARTLALRDVDEDWIAGCRPRPGEEPLLEELREALVALRRAQSVRSRLGHFEAARHCIDAVERVLLVRLDGWLARNRVRCGEFVRTPASERSFDALWRYIKARERPKQQGSPPPSLLTMAHWFLRSSRLTPEALTRELEEELGFIDDELVEGAWRLGLLRNVLAHRVGYERKEVAVDEALANIVVCQPGRVDLTPGAFTLLLRCCLLLHGFQGTPEMLAKTLERYSAEESVGPGAVSESQVVASQRAVITAKKESPSRSSTVARVALPASIVGVAALVLYARAPRPADSPVSVPSVAPPMPAPVEPSAIGAAVLSRWSRALETRDYGALAALYVQGGGGVSWHSSRIDTPQAIGAQWSERFGTGALFDVNTASLRVAVEAPDQLRGDARACANAGATGGSVLRLGFDARWQHVRANAVVPCSSLHGPYFLRARQQDGEWRICHEGWEFCDAICASCPGAADCARCRRTR